MSFAKKNPDPDASTWIMWAAAAALVFWYMKQNKMIEFFDIPFKEGGIKQIAVEAYYPQPHHHQFKALTEEETVASLTPATEVPEHAPAVPIYTQHPTAI